MKVDEVTVRQAVQVVLAREFKWPNTQRDKDEILVHIGVEIKRQKEENRWPKTGQ